MKNIVLKFTLNMELNAKCIWVTEVHVSLVWKNCDTISKTTGDRTTKWQGLILAFIH